MNQIMTAMLMYSQDYDEKITQMWHAGADAQQPRIEGYWHPIYWQALINPYVKNYKIFVCPSCGADAGKPKMTADYPLGTSCDVHDPNDPVQHSTAWDNYHMGSGSYGINTCYARDCTSGACVSVSIAAVGRPAEKILLAEFDKNWHPAGLYLPLAAQNLTPTTPGCGNWGFGFLWGPTDRHTGVRVCGYWDGHVKSIRGGRTNTDTDPNGGISSQYRNAGVDRGGDVLSTDPRPLIAYGTGSDL
jgi:hypothetical protein